MSNGRAITPEIMKDRTKKFAKQIIYLCRKLPKNREGYLIGNQIFRSGTSVASNYRAACRGRSKADFIAKMGIVEEEADETLFWLEVIVEVEIFSQGRYPTESLAKANDRIITVSQPFRKIERKKVKITRDKYNIFYA